MKLNIVPARTGLTWVRQGIRTFVRQPLAIGGLFFMFMAAVSVVALVPFIGPVLAMALVPAGTLGLMSASAEADQGRFPMPSQLVAAFRRSPAHTRAMLTLGSLYAACGIGVTLLSGLIAPMPAADPGDNAVMLSPAFQQAMLVTLALYLPVSVLFWHAPALVYWHGVSPGKSLFFSAVACWRNRGAFVVFCAGWAGVFLIGGVVIVLIGRLFGSPQAAATAMMPLAMVMASMFFASIVFTVRDSFVADEPAA